MRKITMALALVLMVFLVVMIGQKSKERSSKDRLEAKQASQVIKTNTTETKPASASVPQPVPPLPSWFEEIPPPPPQTLTDKQMMALKSAPEKTWTSEELGFSPTKPIPRPVLTDEQMMADLIPPLPAWARETKVPPPPSLTNEEIVDKLVGEYLKKKGLLNEDGSINKKASEKLFMADLPAPKQTFTSEEAGFAHITKPTSKKAKIPSPSAKPKVSPPPSLLPGFILKQESNEEVLARGARDREEARKIQGIVENHSENMKFQAEWREQVSDLKARKLKLIDGKLWQVDDYLGRTKAESARAAEQLRIDLAREQLRIEEELRWKTIYLQFQMEEELNNRIFINYLFRDIYRPRYRQRFYNFTILEPPHPARFVTIWDNNPRH